MSASSINIGQYLRDQTFTNRKTVHLAAGGQPPPTPVGEWWLRLSTAGAGAGQRQLNAFASAGASLERAHSQRASPSSRVFLLVATMFSPRTSERGDWFASEGSEGSRPSTAQSFVTAKSSSTARGEPPGQPAAASSPLRHAQAPVVPALAVLPSLLLDLNRTDDNAAVGDAAMHLCLLLDSTQTATEAAALGQAMRSCLRRLLALLDAADLDARVHQSSLLLLANLAAPDVDPDGSIAADLKGLGVLRRLIAHVSSADLVTVAYALGAIRNNTTTPECVAELHSTGTLSQLQGLANGENDPTGRLRQYAAGCLINVRQLQASMGGGHSGGAG